MYISDLETQLTNCERIAISCTSKDSALNLLQALHDLGYKWCSGYSLANECNHDRWERYKKNTVYVIEKKKCLSMGSRISMDMISKGTIFIDDDIRLTSLTPEEFYSQVMEASYGE